MISQTLIPSNEYSCQNCNKSVEASRDYTIDLYFSPCCSTSCFSIVVIKRFEKFGLLQEFIIDVPTTKFMEENQMVKLSQRAKEHVASGKLKNISELSSIPIDVDVNEKTFAEGTDKEFTAEVFTIDGEDYRMPVTVISALNVILEENPNLKTFKVKKQGSGMGTEYTVIPLS